MLRQIRTPRKRFFLPLHVWSPLTEAEARLVGSIAPPPLATGSEGPNEDTGRDGSHVRASIIRDLCLSPVVAQLLRGKPIVIEDAEITGRLDLSYARIPFPIEFSECEATKPILLHHAHLSHLLFDDCELSGVQANGLIVDGDVVFSGRSYAWEGISLERAKIDGDLSLSGAWIKNADGPALNCASATIGGALYLGQRFSSIGEVSLYNARVGGDVIFDSAEIANEGGCAIVADLVKSDGGIFIRQALIEGEIRMRGAECRSNLEFDGTTIENVAGTAVCLDQARVRGSLYLRQGFRAVGDVVFTGSSIGVDLDLDHATIEGSGTGEKALVASRVRVQGDVYLDEASVKGMLHLDGAHVGGHIRCKNTGLQVMEPTPAEELRGITSFKAKAITVKGSVVIKGGGTNALLDFRSARIGRNFEVRELTFENGWVSGLLLENARVGGEFCWVRTKCHAGTKMVLSHARIGRLRHGSDSWPVKDLYLHGCVYSTVDFSESERSRPEERHPGACQLPRTRKGLGAGVARFFSMGEDDSEPIRWLAQQKPGEFDPQPYEQLAGVLRRSGNDDEAKQVSIAMEKARCAQTTDPVAKALSRAQGFFVEHGHSTRRLWVLSFLWVLMAAAAFGEAKRARVITTANEEVFLDSAYKADKAEPEEYPKFNAFFYSLDAFLPIIELHQEAYWMPNAKRACKIRSTDVVVPYCGGLFLAYLWLHIILGWLATTLMVFSVTGLIRQHNSAA